MADYKEGILKSKQRACLLTVTNKLNEVPVIAFEEEIVTVENDRIVLAVPQGALTENFTNPAEEFNLINPDTGDVIGTSTYMNVYVILHSLYRHIATKRDNYVPPVVEV